MTYHFDPERWYEDRANLLELQRQRGELDEQSYEVAVTALDREYQALLTRLDGTYQLPDEE